MWKFKQQYQDTQLSIPGKIDINKDTISDELVEWINKKKPEFSYFFENDGNEVKKEVEETVTAKPRAAVIKESAKPAKAAKVKAPKTEKGNKESEK